MVKLNNGTQADLELFKFGSCPFCVRVLGKIKSLGIEGIRLRDTQQEAGANAELIERGGKRQVPCLFIDGQPLYESGDINNWLEENAG
jgi:glutaredoxin 3